MSRQLEISTAAGPHAFVVQRVTGREAMNRLFEYRVALLSERADITAEKLLGTNATISLELPGGREPRYFNGYVTRLAVLGEVRTPAFKSNVGYAYEATLSPWLWFLTRTSTSQIFQDKTWAQVMDAVLSRWSALKSVQDKLSTDTQQRPYCVQFRETDFNFFSRLAEQAGIAWFFTHDNGKHQLVLVNDKGSHPVTPGLESLRFTAARADDVTVTRFDMSAEIQPGAFAVGDWNYETPRAGMGKVASQEQGHANAGFEMFDWPGEYDTPAWGEKVARLRLQELSGQYERCSGAGSERALQVGHRVKLAGHVVAALNKEYLVLGHDFVAENNLADAAGGGGATFQCEFIVMPAAAQYRPPRLTPRPSIAGPQTALVVGPSGEEIHTDDLGRVKLRFHWDRYATASDKDSCWVRVSQPWAGKGWGAVSIPRVGQEVVVQFLDGDPDAPLVTGRVYNEDSKPPYQPFTQHKARTGFMTRTYKGGNEDFNELRLDDKTGEEQVYLQAQRNLDVRVKKDRRDWVGGEAHRMVQKDVFDKLGAALHVMIAGDHNEKVDGSLSFKVAQDVHVKAGTKMLADAGTEVHLKAGMKVVLEAGTQLTLKVGGNFIDINPGGVFIKGAMVMVNSGGSAGSGSGAAPIAAKEAKEAITSAGGQKDASAKAPEKPKAFGPQASAFKIAAKTKLAALVPVVSKSQGAADKAATTQYLKVSSGQVTFDAEGNNNPKSPFYSRKVHFPGGASGVTLGRGYDMGSRTPAQVEADLIASGVEAGKAKAFSAGAGLTGADAEKFVKDNKSKLGEISLKEQKALFENNTYPAYAADAKKAYTKASHDVDGAVPWEQLNPRVRDMAVDFQYQQGAIWKKQMASIVQNDPVALASYVEADPRTSKYEAGRGRASYLRAGE